MLKKHSLPCAGACNRLNMQREIWVLFTYLLQFISPAIVEKDLRWLRVKTLYTRMHEDQRETMNSILS
jgi:hypothetical protein